MVIEIIKGNFSRMNIGELNESFPNFCFLKNKNFDNLTILAKKLIKIIMSDYIPIFIVDTYQ